MSGIPQDRIEKIIKIIEIFFPNAKIYLFGSRARGDYTQQSDIDIAIDNGSRFDIGERMQIVNMIDALNMAQTTEVIDFHRVPESLQKNILKDGILWKS